MLLLQHPDSGLYYDEEYIERYAALDEPPMSIEEAVGELERRGFKRVWPEDFDRGDSALLASLVEAIGRIGDNTGRMASDLEAFARLVPLMTPPIGVEDVARLAGVTSKTVYRWKETGLLKPLADTRPLLFDQAEVHDFLRRRRPRREEE